MSLSYLFIPATTSEVIYYRQQRLLLYTRVLHYIQTTAKRHGDLTEWLQFFHKSSSLHVHMFVQVTKEQDWANKKCVSLPQLAGKEVQHISN